MRPTPSLLAALAIFLAASPAAADVLIPDAYQEAGGNRPPSIPPLTWGISDVPRVPFTAINSGPLARIELPGPRVSYPSPNVGLLGLVRLYYGDELFAVSELEPLPDATKDLPEWTVFSFVNEVDVVGGFEYSWEFAIPGGSTWWPQVNWDAYQAGDIPGSVAFRSYLSSATRRAGDVDGDGDVDLTDFAFLKANFGRTGIPGPSDLNGDGTVNLADFNLVKDNFGESGPDVVIVPVELPEPATWLLVAMGAVLLAVIRFRRPI